MKRIIALVLSLVMAMSLCISPVWGADTATEQAAQEFVKAYLSDGEGNIYGHIKSFDKSLEKMFDSESKWDALSDEAKALVDAQLNAAYPGLSYEKLWEWTQGFMFMVEYLVVAEGDYEGYIISADPNGGTLVDPDPPQDTYAIHPFTYKIWQRIVAAEGAYDALSAEAKAYLDRLMTEEGFGLNNEVQPSTLKVASFTDLLEKAKKNLAAGDTELAAQEFVDTHLRNSAGFIFGHVKGFDGSLSKVLDSEEAWNALDAAVQSRVNELVAAAHPELSYEKLWEWTQGFMFMVNHLIVEGDNYEGYIISTDSAGGTLVDPDPPSDTYAVHPFTHEAWLRIVAAEDAFNALSADAKEYLEKLMTEKGFGLNNGIKPADLPICNFTQLLEKAKENLADYEKIEDNLKELNINPEGATQLTTEMVKAIDNGAKIWIDIDVTENEAVSTEKQEQFKEEQKKNGFSGYSINKYLEIDVLMTVEGFYNDPVLVSNTVEEVWIPVCDAKPGFDYAVMREHNGEITLLTAGNKSVVVRGDGKVYVKSSQFSTYAVLEKPKTTGGYVGGYVPVTEETDTTVTSPKTFDAGVGLAAAVTILSMTGMVWLGKKKD